MASKLAIGILVIIVVAAVAAVYLLGLPSTPGSTSGSNTSGSGQMAVMGTDPPYAPGTGTKEYEHYNNVAAHRSQGGGQSTAGSGWVLLNASGTLELNSLANASETMAVSSIQAGSYDAVRLYISSATVNYNGQNYTAQYTSQVTANLQSSAQVSGSSTTAVIFDLRTIVLNVGSSASPQFVVTSSARADVAPSGSYSSSSLQVGAKVDLSSSAWFHTFIGGSAHLQLTGAALSSSSLNATVKDSGSEPSNVTLVVVTPISVLGGVQVVIPDTLQGSMVFTVGPGGNLQLATSLLAQVSSPGTQVAVSSGGSASLTYRGSLQFEGGIGALGVQPGQQYLVTVIGNNSVATTVVTAS